MSSFVTPGLADLRALTTLGVNVKESSAIGFFGTGFKFAVATILRKGEAIDVYLGLEKHSFSTKPVSIRGKDFSLVCLDGVELGFTTELGRKWTMDMAMRELESNTRDEKGTSSIQDYTPQEGVTTIVVSGPLFAEALSRKDKWFVASKPMPGNEVIGFVHPNPWFGQTTEIPFYYKGVKVTEINSLFCYNYSEEIELTEDRTVRHPFMLGNYVGMMVAACKDESVCHRVLTAPKNFFENDKIEFRSYYDMSPEFIEALKRAAKTRDNMTPPALKLAKEMDLINLVPPARKATDEELAMIAEAKAFLKRNHHLISAPIIISADIGSNAVGMAVGGHIVLSRAAFVRGQRYLTETIFEENLHITERVDDCSREMQEALIKHLFNAMELNDERQA